MNGLHPTIRHRRHLACMFLQRGNNFWIIGCLGHNDTVIRHIKIRFNPLAAFKQDIQRCALDINLRIAPFLNKVNHTTNMADQSIHNGAVIGMRHGGNPIW